MAFEPTGTGTELSVTAGLSALVEATPTTDVEIENPTDVKVAVVVGEANSMLVEPVTVAGADSVEGVSRFVESTLEVVGEAFGAELLVSETEVAEGAVVRVVGALD